MNLVEVLAAVKHLGSSSKAELLDYLDPEHEGTADESFAEALSKGFITLRAPDHIILADAGAAFLADESAAEGTEDEAVDAPERGEPVPDEEPKHPYDVAKLRVASLQLSVFQVLRKIERGEIHLNPDFQRAFVWDDVRQSRLIESVLIRIPLPAFYVDASSDEHWAVVDGLQRLTTLFKFWKDGFRLIRLQFLRELEGKTFSELSARYRVQIEDNTQLQFYQLQPGTPPQAKFTIFSRLNTGGVTLTAQEIRHALFPGKASDLLRDTAKSPLFLEVTGGSIPAKRMEDREALLRAFAFLHRGYEEYRSPDFDAFLNESMAMLNNASDSTLSDLNSAVAGSLTKARIVFGRHAFRKIYREGARRLNFNKALFESWCFALSEYDVDQIEAAKDSIRTGFIKMMNEDWFFNRAISYGTGSVASVKSRFFTIQELLKVAT